jgi:hypothetical protein
MRGRPKKLFSESGRETAAVIEEFAYLSEIPVKEATSGPDAEDWRRAMAEEVVSILKNDTWKLVQHPTDRASAAA